MARPELELHPQRSARDRFGFELRSWRKARGLSQAKLGAKVHVSGDLVRLIEVAERWPTRDFAERCDQALDTVGALVRLWEAVEDERRKSISATDRLAHTDSPLVGMPGTLQGLPTFPVQDMMALYAGAAGPPSLTLGGAALSATQGRLGRPLADEMVMVPCRAPDGGIVWMSVPRRAFLMGGVGAAVAAVTGIPTPYSASATELATPTFDAARVHHFRQMRKVLMDSDNLFGPRHVIVTLEEQIRAIQYLCQKGRGATEHRNELLNIQTQFADLCGWLYQDSGNFREAQYWLDRALEWAYTAGDTEAAAFILARKSQLAGDAGDPMAAIGVAKAAAHLAQPGSRAAAIAKTYAGHGFALDGDKISSQRAYDEAHELLSATTDTGLEYGFFLDASYIEVQRARSLLAVGEYSAAAEGFQAAIVALPEGFHRDEGVYLAREAIAHAGARDVDQATNVAMKALTIGKETGSGRIIAELGKLNSDLSEWHRVPVVAEFRDAMRSLHL